MSDESLTRRNGPTLEPVVLTKVGYIVLAARMDLPVADVAELVEGYFLDAPLAARLRSDGLKAIAKRLSSGGGES
jgi:hypothetical protein